MSDEKFPKGSVLGGGAGQPNKNAKTRIHCKSGVFSREPMTGAIALTRYESALRDALATHSRDRVFVAVIDSDGSRSNSRVLAPGESIIFGRHEQARLRHEAMDVSLRHLAVAVAPSSKAGAPLLRVWDLATARPFQTEDGQVTEALTADGPVFATLGSIYLAIIPLSSLPKIVPVGTRALWNALPDREVVSRIAAGSTVRSFQQLGERRQNASTKITRIPSARGPEDCPAGMAIATLRLACEDSSRTFRISLEALERGILIGRYERCFGLRGELDALSRVHLLISKIGQDIVAIDTASTFGSQRSMNRAFESVVLEERDEILLADVMLVGWKYERLRLA